MRLLVSACLLGLKTRYDGQDKAHQGVLQLLKTHQLIPVCPEQLGGLPTPRPPCEMLGNQVLQQDGLDQTAAFEAGAEQTLRIIQLMQCDAAILKQNSPSCGSLWVYNGQFLGKRVKGQGVCARLLLAHGVRVLDENQLHLLNEPDPSPRPSN